MNHHNKRNSSFLVILLLLIGIVYAILQANLQINGTAKIKANSWDVHFDNIQVNESSVSLTQDDSPPTIDPNNNCKIDFVVTLSLPGDFYEFTVDVVNAGTIDAMIQSLNTSLIVVNESDSEIVPDWLTLTVIYDDNTIIRDNHILVAGTTETYRIRLDFNSNITNDQLELASNSLTSVELEPIFIQSDSSAIPVPHPISFANDDWDTIATAIRDNNTSAYHVGDTKEIELEEFGTHTVRLVNMSSNEECETVGFSQTACGFVVEFADIVSLQAMKETNTNHGSWQDSLIRPYMNTTIYEDLPEDLQNAIIDTYVVSGHGSNDSSNYITTDKLYLYSTKEVGFSVQFDSTNLYTRTLDYYSIDSPNRIKKYNGVAKKWWYRVPDLNAANFFRHATADNKEFYSRPTESLGVSPVFRIG